MLLFSRRLGSGSFGFVLLAVAATLATGCADDTETIRKIQSQRQARMQSQTQEDHLGEMFSLLTRLVELNPDEASRQITYHLNRWSEQRADEGDVAVTELVRTLRDVLSDEQVNQRIAGKTFLRSDMDHLRDSYLTKRIVAWVDDPQHDDPLLADWFADLPDAIGDQPARQLQTASRLFDWTVRNIAFEPKQPNPNTPPAPSLSPGLSFEAAGVRQTDYQTLWRGTGDSLQRAGVFSLLCRQAGIPAFVLAVPSSDDGKLNPWCAGVLIDQQIYLFEPELGMPILGPDQQGIATLAEARSDASVLRRLNVIGFFDYAWDKTAIQQCVALLNVVPEAISPRMAKLQAGLTGDRRMVTYVDADALAEQIDAVSGIAGVRLWDVPLLAEVYVQDLAKAAERDPMFNFWFQSRWAILESTLEQARQLSMARWRHLHGDFDNKELEDQTGARVLYLGQRAPEFEIEDLQIDVDLQKAYGIRRELGVSTEIYDRQVQQAQTLMRLGKRTATYWISLIQYDDGRFDTAETWFSERVLDPDQRSFWEPAARFNLARTEEHLGNIDRAVELYKTVGDPQEHGNRLRARVLGKTTD